MSSPRLKKGLLIAAVASGILFGAFITAALMAPVHDGPVTEHFDGERFANIPADATIAKSSFEVLRWLLTRKPGPWSARRDAVYYVPPRRSMELRVTLINHASVLIQTNDINIVTDPVWSDRVSPLPFAGPIRHRDAGIRFIDLPPVDVVLISHNHYDHLDLDSISRLTAKHNPLFVVPLGNTRYLQKAGAKRIVELDWWQDQEIRGVNIVSVPALHWSRRGAFDTNRALWSGYVIQSLAGPVYFAGDTGMGAHFSEISARYGAPRLALLPIGAYRPRWFMAPQHINPAEAVSAHVLLGAKQSMAIHFGTFQLGDDGQDEPIRDLRQALQAAAIPSENFWVPLNGDNRVFEADYEPVARLTAR